MLIIFCPKISFFDMNDFHWKNEKPENVIRSASWHPSLTIFIFFFLLGIPFTFCLSYSRLLHLHLSHIFTKSPIFLLLPTSSRAVPSTGTGGALASAVQNACAGALLSVEVTSGPWGTPCPGLRAYDYALSTFTSMKPTGWGGPRCLSVSMRAMGRSSRWICELLAVSSEALQEVTPQVLLHQWQHGHVWLPFPLGAPGVNSLIWTVTVLS